MAQKIIDFGTFPDDPDADAIRTAFSKVQDNFNELYSATTTGAVTSINRSPGAGITVNNSTGNVIVSANLACLQVSTSTLSIGRGSNGSSNATIYSSSQVLVVDLPANIANISNINLTGYACVAGNITGGNILTSGQVISTGNVIGPTFIGNLSGNVLGVLANGVSNVSIPAVNGNVNLSVGGNANVLVVTGTGANVFGTFNATGNANVGNIGATSGVLTGTLSVTGNANVGNLGTAGLVVATGNVTGGNLVTAGALSVTGNANVGNIGATNHVGTALNITANANIGTTLNVTGNANVGNLGTAGLVVATGNVTGGNLVTAGALSVTGNANVGNIGATSGVLTGTLSVTGNANVGNIGATNHVGTAINITANANIGTTLNVTGNANVGNLGTAGLVVATGNVTGGNLVTGGVLSVTGNANVGNLGTAGLVVATGNVSGGNVTTAGQLVSSISTGTAPIVVTSTTQVANLNAATAGTAGTVTTAAQPNITSVGTLTGLGVNGTVTAVNITANTGVFTGNGSSLTALTGANVTGQVNYAATANAVAGANVSGQVNYAATANAVAGANVSGQVSYAAVANSVAGANVSGQVTNALVAGTVYTNAQPNITSVGTLSSLGVSGTVTASTLVSNVATGTAPFIVTSTTQVANLNVASAGLATYATTANAVAGANVSGQVNYAATANAVAGANVSGQVNYAATANAVAGANVSGTVANANYAAYAGNVTIAGQSNITSLGTLTGLTSNGTINFANASNVNIGSISNLHIAGGTSGYYLQTDGSGNLAWAAAGGGGGGTPGGVNTYVQFNDNGLFGGVLGFTFDKTSGTLTAAYHAGAGNALSNIQGANVSGAVAYATTANAVAGASVSGAVAYATTANAVAGANVSGAVNLATYATTANAVAGANVSGQVANALVAGTVYTAAQPNITSVGTLSSLVVTANANVGNINATGIANITGNVLANNLIVSNIAYVGNGADSTSFTSPTLIAKNTGTQYVQMAVVNSANTGSADLVAYGDNGSDDSGWIDLGFTGSNFNDANYTITKKNDGYIFVEGVTGVGLGGNLVIATGSQGANNDIVFATGGFGSGQEKMRFIHTSGQFYIQPTTAASSTATGALRVAGGVGVAGNIYAGAFYGSATGLTSVPGANVTGQVSYAAVANSVAGSNVTGQVSYAGTANSVAGANVSGTVANATYAVSSGTAGTVTTNAQPNITSVGTLSSLGVTGTTTSGNFATAGNITASFLVSNVATGTAPLTVTSTTQVSNLNVARAGISDTHNVALQTSGTYYLEFVGSTSGNLAGAANATFTANIANGAITATTFVGTLSGAATTAGTVTTAAQPNITSTGTLTGLGVNGTVTAVNITANTGVFTGNGSGLSALAGANVTGTVANATYAVSAGSATTAGTVTTAAQPNITSHGTLTSLNTGNVFVTQADLSGSGKVAFTSNASMGGGGAGITFGSPVALTGAEYARLSKIKAGDSVVISGAIGDATSLNTTYLVSGVGLTPSTIVSLIVTPDVITKGGGTANVASINVTALRSTISTSSTAITGLFDVVNTTSLTTGANTTAGTITGTWTLTAGSQLNATYADLAEFYSADAMYEAGTVLEFGGDEEVTLAEDASTRVAGVISTDPAYAMNANCSSEYPVAIALQGRVPVKVRGTIRKGDMLISGGNGYARPCSNPSMGTVIGKALQNFSGDDGVIEVAIGRI